MATTKRVLPSVEKQIAAHITAAIAVKDGAALDLEFRTGLSLNGPVDCADGTRCRQYTALIQCRGSEAYTAVGQVLKKLEERGFKLTCPMPVRYSDPTGNVELTLVATADGYFTLTFSIYF